MNVLNSLLDLIKRQPVYTMGAIIAGIGVATSFGLNWSGIQIGSVEALAAAILTIITQKVVTPVAAPVLPAGSVVAVQGTEATQVIGAEQ